MENKEIVLWRFEVGTIQQLSFWQGKFGIDYTDRCVVDWHTRFPAFKNMLSGLPIRRVLEVGCNRGHNLLALRELFGDDCEILGIDPNLYALKLAKASSEKISILRGHAFSLPFEDGYFDLVFTAGVLIHIPLVDLSAALSEIYRVSKLYILSIEYFAEEDTIIHYHGHDDMLWKRDLLKHYLTQYPNLTLIRSGYWGQEFGFDNTHWWLLEKAAGLEKA